MTTRIDEAMARQRAAERRAGTPPRTDNARARPRRPRTELQSFPEVDVTAKPLVAFDVPPADTPLPVRWVTG